MTAFHRLVGLLDRFHPVLDVLGPHADPDSGTGAPAIP